MSLQQRLPTQAARADPWTLFCPECSQKMKIVITTPAEEGRETRTYECACGERERINIALHRPRDGEAVSSQGSAEIAPVQMRVVVGLQPTPAKTVAALSPQSGTKTGISAIRVMNNQGSPPQTSARDAMLAAAPSLRAFAISLCRNVDRAEDFVQETLLRGWTHLDSFQPGTNMSAWLFTILSNLFRSDYRKRRREVEDVDGSYLDSLKSPPEQHSQVELREFCNALAMLPFDQREALLLVGASGFSYQEAADICAARLGTIKSRVHRARTRLSELLGIDNASESGLHPLDRSRKMSCVP